MEWINFISGALVGGFIGVVVMALLNVSRWKAEDEEMADFIEAQQQADAMIERGMQ